MSAEPRSISPAAARRFLVRRHLLAPPRSLPRGAGLASCPSSTASDRSSSTPSRSPAATTICAALAHRRLPPRQDRRPPLRRPRACTRPTTRASRSSPGRAAVVSDLLESAPRRTGWPVRRARPARRGAARPVRDGGPLSSTHVEPRAAIDWYWRPTNQVRALLEALAEAGILDHRRAGGQPPRLRPRRAAVPREDPRAAGPPVPRPVPAQAPLPVSGAPGCSGSTGEPAESSWMSSVPWAETGHEDGPAAEVRRPSRAGRRARGARSSPSSPSTASAGCATCRPPRSPVLTARSTRSAGQRPPPVARRPGVAVPRSPRPARLGSRSPPAACTTSTTCGRSTSPPQKRRWGYYVLPIHFGDRLVGLIEPRLERKADTLRIARAVVGGRLRPAVPGPTPGFAATVRRRAARPCRRSRTLRKVGAAAGRAPPGHRRGGPRAAVRERRAGPRRPAVVAAGSGRGGRRGRSRRGGFASRPPANTVRPTRSDTPMTGAPIALGPWSRARPDDEHGQPNVHAPVRQPAGRRLPPAPRAAS